MALANRSARRATRASSSAAGASSSTAGAGFPAAGAVGLAAQPPSARIEELEPAVVQASIAASLDELAIVISREARNLASAASAEVVAFAADGGGRAEATNGHLLVSSRRADGKEAGRRATSILEGPARSEVPCLVQRLPMSDRGQVVGSLTVSYAQGQPEPDDRRLALVRTYAAIAGTLIGRQRDLDDRSPAARGAVRRSNAGRAERMRIARELHDGVIQSLYGLGLLIRTQAERTDLPEKGRRRMAGWVSRIDGLVEEATAYVAELEVRGDALVDLGAGIDAIAEEAAAAGLDVSTEVSSSEDATLSTAVRRELLIVAREAASNAIKHARAHRLALHVEIDPSTQTATLTVDDDGVGFEPALHRQGGHGLDNMAARAAALKGSLDVLSRRSAGTRVRLRVPLRVPAGGKSCGIEASDYDD